MQSPKRNGEKTPNNKCGNACSVMSLVTHKECKYKRNQHRAKQLRTVSEVKIYINFSGRNSFTANDCTVKKYKRSGHICRTLNTIRK
jgi:hypothetical protein